MLQKIDKMYYMDLEFIIHHSKCEIKNYLSILVFDSFFPVISPTFLVSDAIVDSVYP